MSVKNNVTLHTLSASTLHSHPITDVAQSAVTLTDPFLHYNINDFLPPQTPVECSSLCPFNSHLNIALTTAPYLPERTDGQNCNKLLREIASKTQENEQIRKQNEQHMLQRDQMTTQIEALSHSVAEGQVRIRQLQTMHAADAKANAELRSHYEEAQSQLRAIKQKHRSNIRIFCQKYQVSFEPKKKQSYAVEVQTQEQYPSFQVQRLKCHLSEVPQRKYSHHSKPQFLQMYQQRTAENTTGDFNAMVTERSQFLPSDHKPHKPSSLMRNASAVENPHKKYELRLQSCKENKQNLLNVNASNASNKSTIVRHEQLQIYPITSTDLERVIEGVLAQMH